MHLTRRLAAAAALILTVLAGAAAGGKPRVVFDVTNVGGRAVLTGKITGRGLRDRTRGRPGTPYLLSTSPDGRRIAWSEIDDLSATRGRLVVAKAKGGRARDATEGLDGVPVRAAWSPDSRALVFRHRDATTGRADIYRVKSNGKKRELLTGGLEGSAGDNLAVFAFGAALFTWSFPDRDAVVVADDGGAASITDGLPAGAPGGHLRRGPRGQPVFSWLVTGEELPRLYEERDPVLVDEGLRELSADGSGSCFVALTRGGERLVVQCSGSTLWRDTQGEVRGLRCGSDWDGAYFSTLPGESRVRVFRFAGDATHPDEEVLADRTLEAIEAAKLGPDGRILLLLVREAGVRRIVLVREDGTALDPAAGLGGDLGAFVELSPDGDLVLFTLLDGAGEGSLMAFDVATGDRRDLTLESGVPGIPGRGVFSARTGDLLFSTVAAVENGTRLFGWRRKKDRIVQISPTGYRVGTFLFSR